MTNKRLIRTHMKKERAKLSPEEVKQCSDEIARKICESSVFNLCSTVLLYRSVNNEVDTDIIAKVALENYKKIAYPRTNMNTHTMNFYYVEHIINPNRY